jgi:hypothetical protein
VLTLYQLGCHRNRMVLHQWESDHVHPFLLPTQVSKITSPCDHSFFASLKARLREVDTSTPEAKGDVPPGLQRVRPGNGPALLQPLRLGLLKPHSSAIFNSNSNLNSKF